MKHLSDPVNKKEILDRLTKEFHTYMELMIEKQETKILWTLPYVTAKGYKIAILVQLLPLPDENFIRDVLGMKEEKPL